jgi:hypothetical protein
VGTISINISWRLPSSSGGTARRNDRGHGGSGIGQIARASRRIDAAAFLRPCYERPGGRRTSNYSARCSSVASKPPGTIMRLSASTKPFWRSSSIGGMGFRGQLQSSNPERLMSASGHQLPRQSHAGAVERPLIADTAGAPRASVCRSDRRAAVQLRRAATRYHRPCHLPAASRRPGQAAN